MDRLACEPKFKAFQFNSCGKTLVKGRIPCHVDHPVGQFVEHQGDHAVIVEVGKAGVQRIVKPAQCRVGCDTADERVVALSMEALLFPLGIFKMKIPSVGLTPENRIAPLVRLQENSGTATKLTTTCCDQAPRNL